MILLIFIVFLCFRSGSTTNPIPLTDISATPEELAAFVQTVEGTIAKLKLKTKSVVHILGASDVEANVKWQDLCVKFGISFVLVGPKLQVGEHTSCTTYIPTLYNQKFLQQGLQQSPHLISPDLVLGFNLDIYMIYWRRTLAELLQLRKPVVVTMYCSYEGHKLVRLMKWSEREFTLQTFEACDRHNNRNNNNNSALAINMHSSKIEPTAIPEIVTLWEFEPNPHAHAPPKNCYSDAIMEGREHGVRNSFWIGFKGADEDEDEDEDDDERSEL